MRKTKIVCTLGPSSSDKSVLESMLKSGMNVARFNFSHGTHEQHAELMKTFREVRDSLKVPAAVLLDTKGPEIRIGVFENGGTELNAGEVFTLTAKDCTGDNNRVSITYKDLPKQMLPQTVILLDDGKIRLEVTEADDINIKCKVISGGRLTNRKSINIPGMHIDMPYLSARDEEDLKFGVEQDVDFVAASFVRCAQDVIDVRNLLDYHGGQSIKIIAKIENSEGVDNFDEILKNCDGIMVARGDMGVEIEYERLPGIQKRFIKKCYQAGKVVITATQMLESMIHSSTPTRAEITDVANAVFDGTSAIMLSAETAMGDHPALVVETMARIAEQAERDAFDMEIYKSVQYDNDMSDTTNAICDAACTTARDLKAAAILAVTRSGYTARRVSKFRPIEPIVATTPNLKTFHQLSLSWGVYPLLALYQHDTGELFDHAIACAKMFGYVHDGDRVVITAGTGGAAGTTDLLKVQSVCRGR